MTSTGAVFFARASSLATASTALWVAAAEYCGNSGSTTQRSTPAAARRSTAPRMEGSP
jgi:hypothetical protein